ncbi:DUF3077 domain-containing protein [Pseudomonas aeruginosa]|nr:DUF3077 domain-containing protein [Pseudomonas aeruginosa]
MAKTTATGFHPCGVDRHPLFAVQPGLPLSDALDSAFSLLDVAEELAAHLGDPGDHSREQIGHACHMLLQMAVAADRKLTQ